MAARIADRYRRKHAGIEEMVVAAGVLHFTVRHLAGGEWHG